MTSLPQIRNYGNYSSENYGAHSLAVSIGTLTVYFSYRTPVAFETSGRRVVRENSWGPTTGRHLNWIDDGDKASRIPGADFERLLAAEIANREAVVQPT